MAKLSVLSFQDQYKVIRVACVSGSSLLASLTVFLWTVIAVTEGQKLCKQKTFVNGAVVSHITIQ